MYVCKCIYREAFMLCIFVYVCICMYACIYICICMHICVYVFKHDDVHTYKCIHTNISEFMLVCIIQLQSHTNKNKQESTLTQ